MICGGGRSGGCGGEEKGENAADSWNTCIGDSLGGSVKKDLPLISPFSSASLGSSSCFFVGVNGVFWATSKRGTVLITPLAFSW